MTDLKTYVDEKLELLMGAVAMLKQPPQFLIIQREDDIKCIPTSIEKVAGFIPAVKKDPLISAIALLFSAESVLVPAEKHIGEEEFNSMTEAEKQPTIIGIIHSRKNKTEYRLIYYSKSSSTGKILFSDLGWDLMEEGESYMKNPFKK